MKAAKTSKKLKEMPYPPQKKLFKRKGNSITLESQIIGGLDIVIIINNRGRGREWVGIKMSWVEKSRKVNNWEWGWTIIRDSTVHKQRQMPQFLKLLQKT